MYFNKIWSNLADTNPDREMVKRVLLFLILSGLCLQGFAQKSLSNGWIELNNGDTLYGKIQEKDWYVNPDKITFSKENSTVYSVGDLKSFALTNGDIYRRYTVVKHLLPYNDSEPYPENEKKTETVTGWLKLVVQATISLAELRDKERNYFYAIDKGGNATELVSSKGTKNFASEKYAKDPRYGKFLIVENNEYRGQLYALFPDKKNSFDAAKVDYTEASLAKLFTNLNGNAKPIDERTSFYIGLSSGISDFSSHVKGETGTLFFKAKIDDAISPFFQVSFHFEKPGRRNRVSFVPEIGVSFFNTTGKQEVATYTGTYTIKNTFLEAGFLTRILLTPSGRQGFYVAGGINSYFKASGNNTHKVVTNSTEYTKDEPVEKKVIVAPSVSAGVLFSKFNLFVNYQHLFDISNYLNSKWIVSRYSAGVSFYLKKQP